LAINAASRWRIASIASDDALILPHARIRKDGIFGNDTERHLSENAVRSLRAHQRDRLKHIEHRNDGDDGHGKLTQLHDEIELQLIAAERQQINDLFRSGKLKDEARRRIERELDLREAQLVNQQAEE
jgi:monovalent cation/hydrogen antiporter